MSVDRQADGTGKNVAKVRIRMELSYKSFNQKKRSGFLSDLAKATGLLAEDINVYKFRSGCVEFIGDLPVEIIEKIVKMFSALQGGGISRTSLSAEEQDFLEYIEKWNVSRVEKVRKITRFHVRTKQMSGPTTDARIIFVHGWLGGTHTWARVPERLGEMTRIRCVEYEYPTNLTIWHDSAGVTDIANNLDSWIRNEYEGHEIAFVAHSLGGIIVRKMLVSQIWREKQIDGLVKQVTFVASPHGGAPLASLSNSVPVFRDIISKKQLRDLRPDSDFLFELNSSWARWCGWNPHCSVRSIYGTDDKVVPATSARGLDPEAVPIFADHTSIVKLDDPDGQFLKTLARFVKESGLGQGRPIGPESSEGVSGILPGIDISSTEVETGDDLEKIQ